MTTQSTFLNAERGDDLHSKIIGATSDTRSALNKGQITSLLRHWCATVQTHVRLSSIAPSHRRSVYLRMPTTRGRQTQQPDSLVHNQVPPLCVCAQHCILSLALASCARVL